MANLLHNILIVGLGNPGERYALTRHNIGFLALESYLDSNFVFKKSFNAKICESKLKDIKIFFIQPQTFMNLSGESVREVMKYYKIPLENVLVIHDDLDLRFGEIRLKIGGSSGGHNGIKNIDAHVGQDYMRLRIGIKSEYKNDASLFVLDEFSKAEQKGFKTIFDTTKKIIDSFIEGRDIAFLQNKYTIKIKNIEEI